MRKLLKADNQTLNLLKSLLKDGSVSEGLKSRVKEEIERQKPKKYQEFNHGFLTVRDWPNKFEIFYGGNMGATIQNRVNPALKELGFQTIEVLKKRLPRFKESGSPDYSYSIIFTK